MSLRASSLETILSVLLRTGVSVSLLLIVAGTVISFVHHPEYLSSDRSLDRLTHPGRAPHRVAEVVSGVRDLRGQAIVTLGLLVLLATPVLRVVVSLAVFRRERDLAFTILTALVLLLLAVSVTLGRVGD